MKSPPKNLPLSSLRLKVCLIAPAWVLKNPREFARGVSNLTKLGFEVINPRFRRQESSPHLKALELMKALAGHKNTPLVLAIRGGFGSMKILPLIDFEKIKREKSASGRKILAGFSDISAILNPLHEKTGMVGLHSPMLWNFSDKKLSDITVKSFLNAIKGFPTREIFDDNVKGLRIFRRGNPPKTSGILKGGNMVTLGALIGTPWETDTRGTILFLEDVDEKKHEIDRMFSHWAMAGKFDRIKGLILGDFRGTEPDEVFSIFDFSTKKLRGLKYNFPVVYCPYLGHTRHKITLPVGIKANLDASGKKPSLEVVPTENFKHFSSQRDKI